MSEDITFCANKCGNLKCFRNSLNIKDTHIPHSFAFLERTEDCPLYKESETWITNRVPNEDGKYKCLVRHVPYDTVQPLYLEYKDGEWKLSSESLKVEAWKDIHKI